MSELEPIIPNIEVTDPRSALFRTAGFAMFVIDPADAKILVANPAGERLFGLSGDAPVASLETYLSILKSELLNILHRAAEVGVLEIRDRHAPIGDSASGTEVPRRPRSVERQTVPPLDRIRPFPNSRAERLERRDLIRPNLRIFPIRICFPIAWNKRSRERAVRMSSLRF